MAGCRPTPEALYRDISDRFAAPLQRLARAYEADADRRQDLLQEIHFALWRSLERYEARCSLRTWVYRVAHNVAYSHVSHRRRMVRTFVSLEDVEAAADGDAGDGAAIRRDTLARILALIQRLEPTDRQIMLSYLEGLDAASIGEITGMSARNVATKVHRIKVLLTRRLRQGAPRGN